MDINTVSEVEADIAYQLALRRWSEGMALWQAQMVQWETSIKAAIEAGDLLVKAICDKDMR